MANIDQLNRVGKTVRIASTPPFAARIASAMKTYNAISEPNTAISIDQRLGINGMLGSSICATSVPPIIINAAIDTGAMTGPHQGNGNRNKMSQSRIVWGQPLIGTRKI